MFTNSLYATIPLRFMTKWWVAMAVFVITLLTFPAPAVAQNQDLKSIEELIITHETLQELNVAIRSLEETLTTDSLNAQACLLLAYAYTQKNGNKSKNLSAFSFDQTHFTEVINLLRKAHALNPGIQLPTELGGANAEILLASQWCDLSLSYKVNNKPDSALWVLQQPEVKKDFSPFWLSVNKNKLLLCDSNAILLVMGRNFFPFLYYLQEVEQIRTDVSVVDIFHLVYFWYLQYTNSYVLPDPNWYNSEWDSLKYLNWSDTTIYTQNQDPQKTFAWNMKPSYLDKYIIRDQILLLELVKFYAFKNPIYFSSFIDDPSMLSLTNSCANKVWINHLNLEYEPNLHSDIYTNIIEQHLGSTLKYYNPNIPLHQLMLDALREQVFRKAGTEAALGNAELATNILMVLEKNMPIEQHPISDEFQYLESLLHNISSYLKSE